MYLSRLQSVNEKMKFECDGDCEINCNGESACRGSDISCHREHCVTSCNGTNACSSAVDEPEEVRNDIFCSILNIL